MKLKISCLYEINTRVWIDRLSKKYGKKITFSNIPDEEIARIKDSGFDALWLMGVWLPSEIGHQKAVKEPNLLKAFKDLFPSFTEKDIGCSPYSISGYDVNPFLGDNRSLRSLKQRLNKKGIRLILDFVPNHLAMDHPWVLQHPDYFINGSRSDLRLHPDIFFTAGKDSILAHGKDPYFPAWNDVVQVNYFNPATRKAMLKTLLKVSALCDGVRCDMAMLIITRLQKRIWGSRVFGKKRFKEPKAEFWENAIPEVKKKNPDFTFIAEVYWGMDRELIAMGFDLAYDKYFYDALRDNDLAKIKFFLKEKESLSLTKLKFIENHDEGRALTVFGREKSQAAALIMGLAQSPIMIHEGQMEGFRNHLTIQLARCPEEKTDRILKSFYTHLMPLISGLSIKEAPWNLSEPLPAWNGNSTFKNFIVLSAKQADTSLLVIINYSPSYSQCYVPMETKTFRSKKIVLQDKLHPFTYIRNKSELKEKGLYMDLTPYQCHFFEIKDFKPS
jgi:glycosidase